MEANEACALALKLAANVGERCLRRGVVASPAWGGEGALAAGTCQVVLRLTSHNLPPKGGLCRLNCLTTLCP